MRKLVALLDESAPSFCYYDRPSVGSEVMTPDVFRRVMDFADAHLLDLQILCGDSGVPGFVEEVLRGRDYQCYVPLEAASDARPFDVVIVDAHDMPDQAPKLGAHRGIVVLRARLADLASLTDAWELLAERVYRVVLVLVDLDSYDVSALEQYSLVLNRLRQRLEEKYLHDEALELSVLSDRIALSAPAECGAGIDHLTVCPSGLLYLCPGFAAERAFSIGHLSTGWSIPDHELLDRRHAPICDVCDAYHCRRCVYLNRRATLELNTAPWQYCRTAHIEREASRQLLADLHRHRLMGQFPPIPPIDYDDPLDHLIRQREHLRERRDMSSNRDRAENIDAGHTATRPAPVDDAKEQGGARISCARPAAVGRVTEAERDRIRELHLRQVGLKCILQTLSRMDERTLESTPLYEKVVRDMATASLEYQTWWNAMAAKYDWRSSESSRWTLDFETCEVFPAATVADAATP